MVMKETGGRVSVTQYRTHCGNSPHQTIVEAEKDEARASSTKINLTWRTIINKGGELLNSPLKNF